jgi:hypothetical protein
LTTFPLPAFTPLASVLCRAMANTALFAGLTTVDLTPLPAKGLAHEHWHVMPRGAVVRVPRWSQVGLDPAANLHHQVACFARAAASGRTPHLLATLPPTDDLPMGALVVRHISGHSPRLPEDLTAIADSLATLHALPLPPEVARPPLASPVDPVAATLALVNKQASWFARADLPLASQRLLEQQCARVQQLPPAPPPQALVGTDTHPGNFLIDAEGVAWLVDLEKVQYGSPAIDLAHASLYTSTTWDADCAAVLTPDAVAAFYAAWCRAAPPHLVKAMRPWLQPVRRLVWLRSLTWMARWRVEGEQLGAFALPAVRAHVQERITDFFAPETLARIRDGLDAEPAEYG